MADSVVKLKVDSREYDSKIKRAAENVRIFGENCKKAGQGVDKADRETLDYVRSLGRMETVSKTAKGKIGEMTKAFTDLSVQYRHLTDQEKSSPFGKALAQSLDQLKGRITESKKELADISNSLNTSYGGKSIDLGGMSGLSSMLGQLGGKFGISTELTGMLTASTMGLTAAIGGGIAAVGLAVEKWSDYNAELAKAQQITSVTTGLSGPAVDEMTDTANALVEVYGVDFREAINAANTLMTQFGVTGDYAMQLIRDGLQGMVMGDGPKLLSMIQQYAPVFRDAGIEASQLVAVIHNTEGGIFTDENMNAIVMGIRNIRLMTDKTSESLKKLGIDGEEMTQKMNEGTLTVFDALRMVAEGLEKVDGGSQTAGEVMQNVFGRQGTMAGSKLSEAIATLNTNLEETKKQTGEVGEGYDQLVQANRELETAMRECFGYNGWQSLANGIKTELVGALTFTIETINQAKSALQSLWDMFGNAPEPPKLSGDAGGGSYNGDVYVESVDQQGNVVKATHNGIDVTDQVNGVVIYGRRRGGGGRRTGGGSGGGRTGGRGGGGRGTGVKQETPQERAEKQVAAALANYQKTITEASWRFEAGLDDQMAYSKKELAAQDRLTNAYAEAYAIHADPKYKAAFAESAEKYLQLSESLEDMKKLFDNNIEEQKRDNPVTLEGSIRQGLQQSIQDADMNALTNLMKLKIENGLEGIDIPSELLQKAILGDGMDPIDIPDEYWQALAAEINEELAKLDTDPYVIDVKTGNITKVAKEAEEGWQEAARAVQAVGGALQQLEDPSAKIAGIIGQAIANIALGFAQATAASGKAGIFGWIAAIAGGIGTMISTINAIHSATGYSEGGMIKGNSYSGDNIMANGGTIGLNAGEIVLNRAQAGNLAAQLSDTRGGVDRQPYLDVETIWLGVGHFLKRRGMGEIVTTKG